MNRVLNFKKDDKCIVAIERGSNMSRHRDMSLSNIDDWIAEGIVTIISKKYITVDCKFGNIKFVIDNCYENIDFIE